MGKYVDLTGKQFGKLTVIGRDYSYKKEHNLKNSYVYWKCQCECGNAITVSSHSLKRGSTKSCGCLRVKNLNGKTFGYLTVLSLNKERKRKRAVWHCKCKCGNECDVVGSLLISGETQSCGCYQREQSTNNLIGQRFGRLLVLKDTGKRTPRRGIVWRCKCDCGNECDITGDSLVKGDTNSCGCLKSIGESRIQRILEENKILFEKEKIFKNFKTDNNHYYRYDFYLPDYNCLIEYDGKQHFEYSATGWNNKQYFEKTQERDKIKNNWCKENNISLIRIPYTYLNNIQLKDLIPETSNFLLKGE